MAKTVIRITDLSEESIDKAIKEVEKYKKSFEEKSKELCKRFAEKIADEAQRGFSGAIVDDLTAKSGGARMASVNVTKDETDGGYVVTANGEDAVWVEFGAGVHHNGAVGSSPNPYGLELGFTIGGFGANGVRHSWGFIENGELKITHGTPASMPMYKAVQTAIQDLDKLAKEVFG